MTKGIIYAILQNVRKKITDIKNNCYICNQITNATTMLIKFAVTNYRGFSNRIEWNLANPSNYEFNSFAIKNGIIKSGIIYGPNGGGKTNFGLALFDIVNHLSQKWKKPNYYENFPYAGKVSTPVLFEYTFRFGNVLVEYTYSKNRQGVLLNESLSIDRRIVFKKTEQEFDIDIEQFPLEETIRQNLRHSANGVSIINFLVTSYPLVQDHYLLKLRTFVDSMLWFRGLRNNEFIGYETNPTILDEYIIDNNLVDDFADFIYKVSGQKFNFAKSPQNIVPTEKQLLCIIDGITIPFNLIMSTGTDSLRLLYVWMKKIGNSSFVFIDEFDAFYHFKLSFEVCKRLFNLNCQVFLSSHNTYLMTNDLLRPDCNFIIQDNKIKPLCDCTEKELRFGHNIEKLFRGGPFVL